MSKKLRIVVADDERDTREYLQEYLTYLGHDVRAAEDGQKLVELCQAFVPDLIVTDFAMPRMNGLAAAAEVNREHSVAVIVLSGRHDVESVAIVQTHIIAFLAKPLKPAELKAAVQSAATGLPYTSA